ncbi:MAG: imelysin family protein [Chloroherpetonaceae bacterium]|nr:imelysin family protein [Chloroherpetonaceae bacterium]
MLRNFADNYILPAYQDLDRLTQNLDTTTSSFLNSPTSESLVSAQTAWINAYDAWQYAQHFEFGPAETSSGTLLQNIGTYPINTTQTEAYISSGDSSLNNFNRDTRGFLAIEYLLFGKPGNTELVNSFTGSAGANRRAYLRSIVRDLRNRISSTRTQWENTYRNEFIINTGTDVASSTTKLFNSFVASYENLKNFKFGVPLGKRAGQVSTEPSRVEAYYSGRSTDFAKSHFTSVVQLWEGTTLSGDAGIGFEEYLSTVTGGEALISSTKAQLEITRTAINALGTSPLQTQISSNFNSVNTVHTELQRMTRYFKSDMASLLGLTITFSSNDGD